MLDAANNECCDPTDTVDRDDSASSSVNARVPTTSRWFIFHDHFAQYLTALVLHLRALREQVAGDPALLDNVRSLECLVSQMNDELYRIVDLLDRPDARELMAELDVLAAVWARSGRFRVWRRLGPLTHMRLPSSSRETILGVVREAVTNVARHSGARAVMIRGDRVGDRIRVIIADSGIGFDPNLSPRIRDTQLGKKKDRGGNGIRGMHERARAAGGNVLIRSAPGKGTAVVLTLPDPEAL